MRKKIPNQLYYQLFVVTLFLLGSVTSGYSQCPTVTNQFQSFCDLEAPMISDLDATNNGGGVFWYATATSTTRLSNSTGLINGEDYFADNATGSCGTRQRVEVKIYGPPSGLSFQGVCVDSANEATIANLFAGGNDIQWYDRANGGTPLASTTVLNDDTIYYVDQGNPDTGCRSSRRSVYVNVGVTPVPTGDALQEFCSGTQPTIANLVASGTNHWYSTISSGSPLPDDTLLVDGQTYYATTYDDICESEERLEVTVQFVAPNDSGTNGSIDICSTDVSSTGPINLFDALGGSPATNGTWRGPYATTNGSQGTVVVSDMTAEGSPYVFSYDVTSDSCPTSTSTVTITIIAPPNPGTNGNLVLCSNDAPVDLFDSLEGTPELGGTWSPALASGSGMFDPSQDAPGNYTYTVTGDAPCGPASASVNVTVNPEAQPGTNGALVVCIDSSPVDLFNSLGGTPQPGGTWSPALASGTGVFNPSKDAAGTYIYNVSGITPCGDATASVTVTVNPLPNPGENGSLVICSNDAPVDLFDSLEGSPEPGGTWSPALASGSGMFDPSKDAPGNYTYTVTGDAPCGPASASVNVTVNPEAQPGTNGALVVCIDSSPVDLFNSLGGTPQPGGTWSPALASGTGVFDPSKDAAGTYIYNVSGITPCGDATASVTVTVNPLPNPGENGSLVICSNDAPVDLFDSLEGTPEPGGTWSPALASGSGMFDPSQDAPGNYTYTVTGDAPCGPASASVNVTVNPEAQPGTNGALVVCIDSSPVDLFNSLGGTPQPGGTWSPALASGTGVFDPSKDAAGTYIYNVSGITPCGDATASVTVTVNPLPNAGENGSLVICSNDAPVDLFDSLEGTPETGGTWSPALASGSGMFDPSQDAPGNYTYTVTGDAPCGPASATVNVTVNPEAQPGTNGALVVCIDSSTVDLFNSLGGTPQPGGTWSPALASGTGVFDPSKDAAGTYIYNVSGITPCGDATASVTVTVNPLPNPGENGSLVICSNDAPVDLFDSLEGTPEPGGTWSPALASGSGMFDPSQDAPGNYTYTVTGDAPCGPASASVSVSITPAPQPGTNGNLIICMESAPENLFHSLGGSPQSGGIWSPALSSGTGIFDPTKDAEGVYTYTVSGNGSCEPSSATVSVSIDKVPSAGTNGALDICTNDLPVDLFESLSGTPDIGGTWSPALSSGTGIFDPTKDSDGIYTYTVETSCGIDTATVTVKIVTPPNSTGLVLTSDIICLNDAATINLSGATQLLDGIYQIEYSITGSNLFNGSKEVTVTNGSATFTLPASQLANAGITTLTITNLINSTTNCGTSSETNPNVQFTIEQSQTPQLVSDGNAFCLEDEPTIADLSNNIIGTNTVIWYDASENGNTYDLNSALIDGTTYYAEGRTASGCSSDTRLEVTVSIERCEPLVLIIPDGFSPNGDNINDEFVIKNLTELYPNFRLQIYNRYGNILYKGDSSTPNWDGRSNQGREVGNGALPVGVYFYILEFNDQTTKSIQGRVYLSR